MTAPIDLAPRRGTARRHAPRALQRAAAKVHVALAGAIVVAVFVQVYLIGAYVFGAGPDALDAHRTAGFTAHGLEVLVLLAALIAWLPRRDLLLSLALAVVGTAQIMLAGGARWVGGLHPLLALVVLVLASTLVRRRGTRRRATETDR